MNLLRDVMAAFERVPADTPLPPALLERLMRQLPQAGGVASLYAFNMAVLKGDLATNAHARQVRWGATQHDPRAWPSLYRIKSLEQPRNRTQPELRRCSSPSASTNSQAALHPGFVQAVIAHGTKHPGNDASRAAAGSVLALLAHTCDEARRLVAAQGDVTVDLMLSSLREVCDTICTADGGGIRGTLQLRTLSVLLAVKEQGGAPAERAMRDPHALLVAVQLCGPRFADADGGRGPALRYLLDAFTPPRGDLSCAAWLDLPARQPPVAEAPLLMHLVPHFAGLLLAPDVPGDARVGLVMLAYRLLRTPGLSPVITGAPWRTQHRLVNAALHACARRCTSCGLYGGVCRHHHSKLSPIAQTDQPLHHPTCLRLPHSLASLSSTPGCRRRRAGAVPAGTAAAAARALRPCIGARPRTHCQAA
jgi:hypothetical protein